ncbi:kinase-like protein [Acephala macrosclerotiorum]|nr:kinase-like protein [Acephala macrosclerotiorum]
MPRSQPHHLALFSLAARNDRAHEVIAHQSNSHLISKLPNEALGINVGFNIRSKSRGTLATLGRSNTDILVEGSSIGRVQCSFEIDLESRVVMLYDRSNSQTTQVSSENCQSFEPGRLRRIVVQRGLNTVIGMGGTRRDLVQFNLIWHGTPDETVAMIKSQEGKLAEEDESPLLARTLDEAPTELPSQRLTRIHTPGQNQLKIRYHKIGLPLGAGNFGTVHKCVDVDLGRLMAVKILTGPAGRTAEAWGEELYRTLKREVETLASINHPHIVDYIGSQGWDQPTIEIFMGLKDGTLASLIEKAPELQKLVAESAFPQMLRALDCLSSKNIIHRDVKPENILYVSLPGLNNQFRFQLGDFGLCNRVIDARTFAGTQIYMAPEMFEKGGQTCKADVWSLFVTILWALNVEDFRQKSFQSVQEIYDTVIAAAKSKDITSIKEMAVLDPEKRASAAQMLIKWFSGEGLSTPAHLVPPLIPLIAESPTTSAPAMAPRQQSRPIRIRRGSPKQDGTMMRLGNGKPERLRRQPTGAPHFGPTKR